jgi:pimeloyl-ACP methyl ester carboxylesterase
MFDLLLKKAASLTISLMLLYVPHDKYQTELDSLPDIEQRVAGLDLQGWQLTRTVSHRTGIRHSYYLLPSVKPNAPVLVCLHGFNTDGAIFLRLKPLAQQCTLVAYNLPEKTPRYTGDMDDFNAILNDFFGTVGLDSVLLLGNSVGGAIALHYAASAHPTTVTHLYLLSTTVFGATPESVRQLRAMADRLLPYPDYKLYYLLKTGKSLLTRLEKTSLAEDTPNAAVVIKHVQWYRQILRALYYYVGSSDAALVRCPVTDWSTAMPTRSSGSSGRS